MPREREKIRNLYQYANTRIERSLISKNRLTEKNPRDLEKKSYNFHRRVSVRNHASLESQKRLLMENHSST